MEVAAMTLTPTQTALIYFRFFSIILYYGIDIRSASFFIFYVIF